VFYDSPYRDKKVVRRRCLCAFFVRPLLFAQRAVSSDVLSGVPSVASIGPLGSVVTLYQRQNHALTGHASDPFDEDRGAGRTAADLGDFLIVRIVA
jgi:hypothetical protein